VAFGPRLQAGGTGAGQGRAGAQLRGEGQAKPLLNAPSASPLRRHVAAPQKRGIAYLSPFCRRAATSYQLLLCNLVACAITDRGAGRWPRADGVGEKK